jgi:hypothetical protein
MGRFKNDELMTRASSPGQLATYRTVSYLPLVKRLFGKRSIFGAFKKRTSKWDFRQRMKDPDPFG